MWACHRETPTLGFFQLLLFFISSWFFASLSLSISLCARKQCKVRNENNELGRIMSLFHRFPSPNDYPVENISMEFIINFYHFSLWLLVTTFWMDWWKMHTFCCCLHRNNEIGWACNDQYHAIISIDQKRWYTHTRTNVEIIRRVMNLPISYAKNDTWFINSKTGSPRSIYKFFFFFFLAVKKQWMNIFSFGCLHLFFFLLIPLSDDDIFFL